MNLKRIATVVALAGTLGLSGLGTAAASTDAEPVARASVEAAQTWHQVEPWYELSQCMFSQQFKAYPTVCSYGQWGNTGFYGYILWGYY